MVLLALTQVLPDSSLIKLDLSSDTAWKLEILKNTFLGLKKKKTLQSKLVKVKNQIDFPIVSSVDVKPLAVLTLGAMFLMWGDS